ncbi:outer membrane protein assembly factor BamC [Thauera sp.]|jgi:outer membrane protein assembly factor BamC|uniref:outer membrane protein assembly factor BamC n=1 Tax=Thauera sp. TaxID=1905334 RepID=UPI001A392BD7|nr:outer membrane protein assembly factor BamC [Thauera sp.]MBL8465699.1 outer membrane protein assembly factor BamC [Thauera sp.]HRO34960.1 outer membrane protein assembly factor BamC [Thauera sp.]
MIRSKRTPLSLLALSIALGGCSGSLLESKRIDYKSAKQIERPLEIPPDLTAPQRDDRFAVPDVAPRGVATYSAYTADRAGQPAQASSGPEVLAKSDTMRIERAGTQRWLVVGGTAEELWPQIKDFWLELGFILNIDSPEIGVMETDWAEDRAKIPQDFVRSTVGKVLDGLFSTPERDKFRTRLEQGKESGTVEVYISHRGMMEIYPTEAKDSTIWQPRPADPELEAEMLRRLMVRLGAEEARAEAAIATTQQAAERARIASAADGQVMLVMDEAFDRAWRRVGLALDRIGFTVEDRDRAQGLYFVRYVDPDADNRSTDKGFLSRLAFWRSDDKPASGGSEYRLRVQGQGEVSRVSVLTREGGLDNSDTARRMLGLLQEQLR